MSEEAKSLLLKRPVQIKVVVTPRWKEEVQAQLNNQIAQIDAQIQNLESQGQSAISQLQLRNPTDLTVQRQIESVQSQVNQKKSELNEQKNQYLNQLQQVQVLELEQEVGQGQLDSFVRIVAGDNLASKMNVEILVRDGVVEELRGDI